MNSIFNLLIAIGFKAIFLVALFHEGLSTSPSLAEDLDKSNQLADKREISIESDMQTGDVSTGVLTAIGSVRIVYPLRDFIATSRQAQYFSKEKRLVLVGDVDIYRKGVNTLKGDRVVYLLVEDQIKADNAQLNWMIMTKKEAKSKK